MAENCVFISDGLRYSPYVSLGGRDADRARCVQLLVLQVGPRSGHVSLGFGISIVRQKRNFFHVSYGMVCHRSVVFVCPK
jgi:hypothetical protein